MVLCTVSQSYPKIIGVNKSFMTTNLQVKTCGKFSRQKERALVLPRTGAELLFTAWATLCSVGQICHCIYLANLSETSEGPRSPVSTRAFVVMKGWTWDPVRTLSYILAPVSFQASQSLSTALWSMLESSCIEKVEGLVESADMSDLVSATVEVFKDSWVLGFARLATFLFV